MVKRSVDKIPVQEFQKKLRLDEERELELDTGKFVISERIKEILEEVDLYSKNGISVLLEGSEGCGKSTIIEAYAHLNGKKLLILNAGEQTDPKSLLGMYVTSVNKPGQFQWTTGILTDALDSGRWIMLDDLHMASPEFVALLLSILEEMAISTGDPPIKRNPDCRIFATCSGQCDLILTRRFMKLSLSGWDRSEQKLILEARFPSLGQLIPLLISVSERISTPGPKMRNLVKICSRLGTINAISSVEAGLSSEMRKFLLLEIADCFVGYLRRTDCVWELKRLLDLLCFTAENIEELIGNRKPILDYRNEEIVIGRAVFSTLPINKMGVNIAQTQTSLQVLEKVAISVRQNEPVLLVGETGTGKTTMIQQLATILGVPQLIILNLSQQSESSDLLGGYRPLSLPIAAKKLVESFERLFSQTFSRTKNAQYITEVIMAFQSRRWERLIKLLVQVTDLVKSKGKFVEVWQEFELNVGRFMDFLREGVERPYFAFIEGALVRALENGFWILLDEINLATSETLQVLSGLLAHPTASLFVGERANHRQVIRHPNFRLFACMNPATDIAKRSLPPSIRSKFSEFYVDETDTILDDLRLVINHYLGTVHGFTPILREAVISLYFEWKAEVAGHRVVDGSRKLPLLNLRTLVRALRFVKVAEPYYGITRALYEGLSMTFLTCLDENSFEIANRLLATKFFSDHAPTLRLSKNLPEGFINVENYLVSLGPEPPTRDDNGLVEQFVLTNSVRKNMARLARAIMAGGHPILLEGPTSAGKTSVIEFLALLSRHRFVRINNHEHTDIQEYIGAYQPDQSGKLVFREGVLTEALRKGYWILLDELNLAPSDVLEALNRLLDDNRELFVAELGETIKPHPAFHLFATQNPAGLYGGRKALSRAFRSRFLEIQFPELAIDEVEQIISKRCVIAPSHAAKLSKVYVELVQRRTGGNIFAGRNSLITLRDLFRWANRPMITIEDLAANGYMVLAERLRHKEERSFVLETIEGVLKTKLDISKLYDLGSDLPRIYSQKITTWTKPMQRLFILTYKAIVCKEPVLLVGETGCGKTTVCQVLAKALEQELTVLNCHQSTETSDFIGSLRPCRRNDDHDTKLEKNMFEWQDGPLIRCMREGGLFLVDEISLAEDSVLERLNSVLESGRTLTLVEALHGERIRASDSFALLATMNPGGDYGKKELSPALRNRFTEIWVDGIGDNDDLIMILEDRLHDRLIAEKMIQFVEWWKIKVHSCFTLRRWPFSVRDILSWALFIQTLGCTAEMIVTSAFSLFIDPAKSMASGDFPEFREFAGDCAAKLFSIFEAKPLLERIIPSTLYHDDKKLFGTKPFLLPVNGIVDCPPDFAFESPTPFESLQRIIRAMKLGRNILLEGSPGVGKTALISAIAQATGNCLTRINLSEQTDLLDLFGSDMPVDGQFKWIDGPFLRALRNGEWILLDELNLASQNVLEGLNACLDHRGEVFIPELDKKFTCAHGTRIFATQNPMKQGGGRKGLPKSFLNRFIIVWIDPLNEIDMRHILIKRARQLGNYLSEQVMEKAISFTMLLHKVIVEEKEFAIKGSPWEFNLRDLLRWVELASSNNHCRPEYYLVLILSRRMRTRDDRIALAILAEQFFSYPLIDKIPSYYVIDDTFHIGGLSLDIKHWKTINIELLPNQLRSIEALIACINHRWLAILHGSVGKTSILKLLASLCGSKLIQVTLSGETDTADLLGSFEQSSNDTLIDDLLTKIRTIVGDEINRGNFEAFVSNPDLFYFKQQYDRIQNSEICFQWKDGLLVQALEEGHWIVLEQANKCSPSVLDRLNSLFEHNGYLTLSEAATTNPRIIKPHRDFRIFMTCSGAGELSRAMRNRGLEIVLDDPDSTLERLSIARAASGKSNAVVKGIISQFSDWNDLGRVASVISQGSSIPNDDLSNEMYPEENLFWFDANIQVFGTNPHNYLRDITEYLLNNIGVLDTVKQLLRSYWTTSFDFVIVDKKGQLINESQQAIDIVQIDVDIPAKIQKTWKLFWKENLLGLLNFPIEKSQRTLELLSKLPVIVDVANIAKQLVSNLSTMEDYNCQILPRVSLDSLSCPKSIWRSPNDLLIRTSTVLAGHICDTIRRWTILANSLGLDRKQRLGLGLIAPTGSLDFNAASRKTISEFCNYLNEAWISQSESHDTVGKLLVSNAVHLGFLRHNALFVLRDNLLTEALLTDDLLKLCNWSHCLSSGVLSRDLVATGMIQLRCIVQLFREDPVQNYQMKRNRIEKLVAINQDLIKCQTTLRAQVLNDYGLPKELQELFNAQASKSYSLYNVLKGVEFDSRRSLSSRVLQLIDRPGLFCGDGQLARWIKGDHLEVEILTENVRAARQRLYVDSSYDLLLPVVHAMDVILLGLECHNVSTVSLVESELFLIRKGEVTSKTILFHSKLPYRERLILYLLYRRLEKSLGGYSRDDEVEKLRYLLKSIHDEEHNNEEVSSCHFNDDDELRDKKIADHLFGNAYGVNDGFLRLLDEVFTEEIFNTGKCMFDLVSSISKLGDQVEDPIRLLIELSYRRHCPSPMSRINVYKDHLNDESSCALNLVRALESRISELLDKFPENDILQSLATQCERFAYLPARLPLISLLTSLEHLLQKAQTWQSLADKTHRLPLDSIMHLIIKWRKLELEGWRCILDGTDEEYRCEAYKKLLWLCQLVSCNYAESNAVEFIGLVDTFLLAAPLGELPHRLGLLRNIQRYPICANSARRLLKQVYLYYRQILERLSDVINEHRQKISKDLKAALISTVWNDKSYWSMKQTVEKSHKILVGQVRKYRDLLDQPTSIVLAKTNNVEKNSYARKETRPALAWRSTASDPLTVRVFNRLGSILKSFDKVFPVDGLDLLSQTIIERVEELSKMTGKDSLQIKQKAFVDLIRVFRHLGLRISAPIPKNQSSVPVLLSHSSIYEDGDEKIDSYLSRCLLLWHELCSMKSINGDLGIRQVEAGRNSIFRALESVLDQRTTLATLANCLKTLNRLMDGLRNRKYTNDLVPVEAYKILNLRIELNRTAMITKQSLEFLKPHLEYQSGHDSIQITFERIVEIIKVIMKILPEISTCIVWIELDSITAVNEHLLEMHCLLQTDCSPFVHDIWTVVKSQVMLLPSTFEIHSTKRTTSSKDYYKEILSLIHKVEEKMAESFDFEMNEFGIYFGYLRQSANILSKWSLPEIFSGVHVILSSVAETLADHQTVQVASVLLDCMKALYDRLVNQHRSLLKLIYVTSSTLKTVFIKGFCRPIEQGAEPQERAMEEGAEGVGMADGAGEKNVSNEIEFEEQITDLMKNDAESDDINDREQDEDDNRIEMGADFSAEIRYMPQEHNDEEEQKESEENANTEAEDQMDQTGNDGELQEIDDGWGQSEQANNDMINEEIEEYVPESKITPSSSIERSELEAKDGGDMEPDKGDINKSEEQVEMEEEDNMREETRPDDDNLGEIESDGDITQNADDDDDDKDDNDKTASEEYLDDSNDEIDASEEASEETPAEDTKSDENSHKYQQNTDIEEKMDEKRDIQSRMEQIGETMNDTGDTLQEARGADPMGSSKKTIAQKGPTYKSQLTTSSNPVPPIINQVIEKIQKALHGIQSKGQSEDQTGVKNQECQPNQLFEEVDVGDEFASGAAENHMDIDYKPLNREREVDKVPTDQCTRRIADDELDLREDERSIIIGSNRNGSSLIDQVESEPIDTKVLPSEKLDWNVLESATYEIAMDLCEQLRLVLEPTKAAKLRGDFRTGKRLNLRKIPAYIASQYRRDKIWLRRTKPSQRTYQIIISLDNSKSMGNGTGRIALEALATISQALTRLEAGELGLVAFGESVNYLHAIGAPWNSDVGHSIISRFTFDEDHTNVSSLLAGVNELFSSGSIWKLHLILSDGMCHDHADLIPLLNAALVHRVITVFIILDPSVCDINHVTYTQTGIKMTKYLETFPFQFYVILRELKMLPTILADSIRQWFEGIALLE